MLAQVAGAQKGVAKYSWPIIYNWEAENDRFWVLDALDRIYVHYLTSSQTNSEIASLAVLSMSWGYVRAANVDTSLFDAKLSNALNKLVSIGVLPITSAGNDGAEVSKIPSIFGDPGNAYHVPGLMVIGGVDNAGNQWSGSSYASFVNVWAPVSGWRPWWNNGIQNFTLSTGTSGGMQNFLIFLPPYLAIFLHGITHGLTGLFFI